MRPIYPPVQSVGFGSETPEAKTTKDLKFLMKDISLGCSPNTVIKNALVPIVHPSLNIKAGHSYKQVGVGINWHRNCTSEADHPQISTVNARTFGSRGMSRGPEDSRSCRIGINGS
jgi:hypothetical protein